MYQAGQYLPDGVLGDGATRVLIATAVLRRPTVRAVAETVGINLSTTHWHLRRLRRQGLVTWEDGRTGTLRATVKVVASG